MSSRYMPKTKVVLKISVHDYMVDIYTRLRAFCDMVLLKWKCPLSVAVHKHRSFMYLLCNYHLMGLSREWLYLKSMYLWFQLLRLQFSSNCALMPFHRDLNPSENTQHSSLFTCHKQTLFRPNSNPKVYSETITMHSTSDFPSKSNNMVSLIPSKLCKGNRF